MKDKDNQNLKNKRILRLFVYLIVIREVLSQHFYGIYFMINRIHPVYPEIRVF